jgi:predicted transposase YbfD/YdcC
LGQIKTEEKSNEITAIPERLKGLELKGCLVTIDAMGCQKKIAETIIEQEADYLLAVKDNQPKLHQYRIILHKQIKWFLKDIMLIMLKLLRRDMDVLNPDVVGLHINHFLI